MTTLRHWQKAQLEKYKGQHYPPLWVTQAGTGTGKTIATLALVQAVRREAGLKDPLTVVLSPLTAVKESWIKQATDRGPGGADDDVKDLADTERKKLLALTYAGLSDTVIGLLENCRRPIILVLDEFHRIEEVDEETPANGWGKTVTRLQRLVAVKHTICLTATPWREGYSSLPFVTYDEDNKVVADFKWLYQDELGREDPGVVEVAFRKFHAECDERVGDTTTRLATPDPSDPAHQFDPKNPRYLPSMYPFVAARFYKDLLARKVMRQMLQEAVEALEGKRKAFGRIKGLVICESIESARTVADYMRNQLHRSVALITSKEKSDKDPIETFRNDETEWCVSVGMLAEGVDVPLIKVVVDFSRVLTLRDIIQRWGRALRKIPGTNTTATVFYIQHPVLVYVARMIQAEIDQARRERPPPNEGNGGGGGEPTPKQYENHDGSMDGAIFRGEDYSPEVERLASWIADVQYRKVTDYANALIIARLIWDGYERGENPLPDGYTQDWRTTEDAPTYSLKAQKQDERAQASEWAAQLARRWFPELARDDYGAAIREVNTHIKNTLMKMGYVPKTGEYNRARYALLEGHVNGAE